MPPLSASLGLAFQAGFLAGSQGRPWAPPPETPSPSGTIPQEWEAFLKGVRTRALTSRGPLNAGAEACAGAFLVGALAVFPEAEGKVFLKTLSRLWGARMSPTAATIAVPVSRKRLQFARNAGRYGGERLKEDHEAGTRGGIGRTVLDHKLHLRNVDDYLGLNGWIFGMVEFLKARSSELGDLLARNRASIIHRAFHSGRPDFPAEAIGALPSLVNDLNREAARWETSDPDVAEALRSNRDTIINRAFHSGDLNYPERAVRAIPAMLQSLDGLTANRASIVSRALNRGDFDYPEAAVQRIPELFETLDREIARLDPNVSKTARILEANRATIVMRALANGNLRYAEEVVKNLPQLLRDLNREIARLATVHPEAAKLLKANRRSVVDRTLNSGVWDYWKRVARALPSLSESFEPAHRAAGVHAVILSGELEPRRRGQK
jgi:hypothetical protein